MNFGKPADSGADNWEQTGVTGFMVLQDEAIVYEEYGIGSEPESGNIVWSVAKSYTVTVLGITPKEGVIESLDDKVEKYAPDFKGTAYGDTSIRHLTMMASGVALLPKDKWSPFSLWSRTYFDLVARRANMD